MRSFLKIASGTLLSLTIAAAGCVAGQGDEETADPASLEPIGVVAQADGDDPSDPSDPPPCPSTLIQSLGDPLPHLYPGGFGGVLGGIYGGTYGGYRGGYYGGAPYYGGYYGGAPYGGYYGGAPYG